MQNHIKIIAILLIVFNISVGIHLLAYVLWNVDILNLNPEKPKSTSMMVLDYPPSGPTGPMITIGENLTMHGVSLSVNIFLEYYGILAEDTPVNLSAIGFLYPDGQQVIDWINVGLAASTYYHASSNVPAQFRPQLTDTNTYTQSIDAPILGTISWNTQGDYYPFIVLNFINGSSPITVNYQDPFYKVHVSGVDVIMQEVSNKKNLVISTDGVILSIVDFPSIIGLAMKRKTKEKTNTRKRKTMPKKSQAYQKTQRKKKTQKKRRKKH